MKCPECRKPLCCESCGAPAESTQAKYYREQLARGECPGCRGKLTKRDGKYIYCFECRKKRATHARTRHARHGRCDRDRRGVAA